MDPLRDAARCSPDAPAVADAGDAPVSAGRGGANPGVGVCTFGELDRRCDRIACGLIRSGLGPGDRVAMAIPHCTDTVALLHGIWRIGALALPLNLAWGESERRAGIEAVGGVARVIDRIGQVEALARGPPRVSRAPELSAELRDPELRAAWVLTSGSAGAPCPVSITHRNLAASASAVIERLDLGSADRWITSLSLAHIGGLALVHRAAVAGCTLVTQDGFDPAAMARWIDSGEVTHASLVPVMLSRLLDRRGDRPAPPSLRCLLVGGAPLAAPLLRRALSLGYPIALTYGLSEATSQVATAEPALVRAKPGTVGRALSGVEVRIDRGGGCPTSSACWGAMEDGAGEIRVRGPTVSKECLVHGWLRTGDVGRLDPDGDLWVTGRASDRIVTGGVTVSPAEVESVLLGHAWVRDVAVFGAPDPEWGERIVALVVAADPSQPPTLDALLDFARPRLEPAKRPRELRVTSSIPRTATGKVDRRRLAGL